MIKERLKVMRLLDWRTLIFILPLFALWSVPLWRAIIFYNSAARVYAETESINAANDVSYATFLLVGYTVCLLIQSALCLLIARTRMLLLMALLFLPVWGLIR